MFPSELAKREHLDKYLSSAFNLPLKDGKLKVIDDCEYVLTLDYALKVCISAADAATTPCAYSVVYTTVCRH